VRGKRKRNGRREREDFINRWKLLSEAGEKIVSIEQMKIVIRSKE
jgi:hypothetical protein